ncbi:MAG: hypothetical protein KDA85_12820 [Planctomycetaceae bacterium]|nr:hypothetical protein [Planctomycetaceae bacterium]
MNDRCQLIAGGYRSAIIAAEPAIRSAVEADFADQWRSATFWQRIWLWRTIRTEINRRLAEVAPPDGLY